MGSTNNTTNEDKELIQIKEALAADPSAFNHHYIKKRERKVILTTIGPVYTWMALFLTIPMVLIIVMGFLTRGTYGEFKYIFTFDNFITMFDMRYFKPFLITILVAFLTTLCCLLIGYPFAYCVAKTSPKYRSMLLMLIIIPFWTNSLVRTYAWIMILRNEGFINSLLMNLGLIDEPIKMLYNYGAIFLGMTYTLFPFMVLPLYTSIEKLDPHLLEAAGDLGATPFKSFIHVTLPLTMPGIVAGSLLVFIPALGYFFIPDLMGGGNYIFIGNLIKNQFLDARNWPLGAALSLLLIGTTLLFVMVYLKLVGGKKEDMGVM